jgi:hypothetical protein
VWVAPAAMQHLVVESGRQAQVQAGVRGVGDRTRSRAGTLRPDPWQPGLEVKPPRVRNADRPPTHLDVRQRAHVAQQRILELARDGTR